VSPPLVALVAAIERPEDFSPSELRNNSAPELVGPNSNTGLKYPTLAAPILDFVTTIVAPGALKKSGCHDYRELLDWIFGTGSKVAMGAILDRIWQFYPQSATLIDETGSVCGKVGFAEDGKICFSITGQGCQHVRDWHTTHDRLVELDARLSRLDIAVDDIAGDAFDVEQFKAAYEAGDFTTNGRPPLAMYYDDMGSGKGSTLEIGQKGHKQLCIYEKGKQLGDVESSYTRCELRLYAKRVDLPLCALIRPGDFFAGAYPLLAEFVVGEMQRLVVKECIVNSTTDAAIKFLKTQAGTTLGLFYDAMGDEFMATVIHKIRREGRPGRWKTFAGDLTHHIRTHLTRENENGQGSDPRSS